MGMLMHHTWMAEQKKKAEKKPVVEVKTEEVKEPEAEVKKTVSRRKSSK